MTETRLGSKRGNPAYRRNRKSLIAENIEKHGTATCTSCSKSNLYIPTNQSYNQSRLDLCTIDHIFPLAKGGTNRKENLVVMCYECNRNKGMKIV